MPGDRCWLSRMDVTSVRRATTFLLTFAVIFSGVPASLFLPGAAAPTPNAAADAVPWPQFGVTPGHSFTYNGSGRGYHDVLSKWRLASGIASGGTAVVNLSSDISLVNATSAPEVLGVIVGQTGGVRIVAGNNGTDMWFYAVPGDVFATPVAADVDGNGKLELILRTDNGYIEAVTPNIVWNTSRWTFPAGNATEIAAQQLWNASLSGEASTNLNLSTPTVADVGGITGPEVLAPAGDRLYMLAGQTGAEIVNRTVDGTIVGAPAVYGSGSTWTILVASSNGTGFSFNMSNFTITAFDASLNFLWSRTYTQGYDPFLLKALDLQLPSPAVGRLDGGLSPDDIILVTPQEDSKAHLRIFYNGSNTYSVNLALEGLTGASPAVTDLNGDGTDEIVALSGDPGRLSAPNSKAFLEVYNGTGVRRWNITIDESTSGTLRENTFAPPAIADFDGDGVKDILVYLTDGSTDVRSGTNGSRIFRTLLLDQAGPTEYTAPAVADFDFDGFLDVTANGVAVSYALAELNGNASEVQLNPANPDEFEDVTVSATIHNTGNANARNVSVSFFDGASPLNETVLLLILPGVTAQAQAVVNFTGGGSRSLLVKIDANNSIEEVDESNNTVVVPVNVSSRYGFHFNSPQNRTAVQPGFSIAFLLNVVADGNQPNTVNLTHGGLPSAWSLSFSPTNLTLAPAGTSGDTNTSFVSVTTSPFALPGEYDINVTGVSLLDPRDDATITFTVIIGGQFGVSLFPPSAQSNVTAGDIVYYSFQVINAGNANDTINFTASAPPPGWTADPSPPNLGLAPGQTSTVLLAVKAPANATSGETALVTLTARSVGDVTKNDTSNTLTTVVVPDLVVEDIQFYRACGGEVTTGVPRLVTGEDSVISVKVANSAQNAPISNAPVILWIEGTPITGSTPIGADGAGYFNRTFRFTSTGTKVVTAEVDYANQVSELVESNNDRAEQALVKDNVPVGDLTVLGFILKAGSPVPFANVSVVDAANGANWTGNADSGGQFSFLITAGLYADGDRLVVNATDGLDVGTAPNVCAYSEDVTLSVNVSLILPSPYDFLLLPAGPTWLSVPPGQAAIYDIDIVNRGGLNNSISVSAQSIWPARVLDVNGNLTSVILAGPGATVRVRVEVTTPAGGAPGDFAISAFRAFAVADPSRTRTTDLNTTVSILRSLLVTGPSNLSVLTNTNFFVNITVSNRGNLDDPVTLTFSDPQGSAASALFTPSQATVPRGGAITVEVRIFVPQATTSGNYTVNLSATSDADTTVGASLSLGLRVTQIRFDFAVSAPPHLVVNPDGTNTTTFSIINTGTVADTFTVALPVLGTGYTVRLLDASGAPTSTFAIDPGASSAVTVELSAPRAVDRESFDIDLRVTSATTGVELTATVRADIGKIFDFRVLPPAFSSVPTIDVEIQVLVTVENAGLNEFFGALPVRMKLGTQEVASASVGHLAVGGRQTLSFTWTPRLVGPVNVTVETNYQPALRIFESDYANNAASVPVQVASQKAPDLLAGSGVLAAIALGVVLVILFAVARRRDEEAEQPKKLEKGGEESDVRRRGGGSGGLERL